jgi:hypothetical protein
MAKIQDDILQEFYGQLENTEGFSKEQIEQLRELFKASKKPKAADLVKVFSAAPKEQLP